MGFNINDLMSQDKKNIRNVKKKQGRPKKKVTKKSIVTTYLTEQENEDLRGLVEESGLTLAAFVRKIIKNEIQKKSSLL